MQNPARVAAKTRPASTGPARGGCEIWSTPLSSLRLVMITIGARS
jgi:hypothetical protein